VIAAAHKQASGYCALKRGIDILGAATLLLVTAPILIIACALVFVTSGAPVIHRRRVVGRTGTSFDAYKVRTMVPDADDLLKANPHMREAWLASGKISADPRVTRVGRVLRRLSIDELPQLLNVIHGDMSLVGPRMLTTEELPAWGSSASMILSVRPGLTGLWQVSGRQQLTREERVRLDDEYVRRMSFGLDLGILLRTVPAVVSGRGAH
jgi:exopolysaccharide production protein ExoY